MIMSSFVRRLLSYLLICSIILVTIVSASTDDEWKTYQHTSNSQGNQESAISFYPNTTSLSSLTFPNGDYTQVLAGDEDNDGTLEVWFTGGNYVDMVHYQLTVDGIIQSVTDQTLAERNVGDPNQVQPTLLERENRKIWVSIANNTLQAFRYRDNDPGAFAFDRVYPNTFTESCLAWSGIRCNDGTQKCYAICQNTTNTSVYHFDFSSNTTTHNVIGSMKLRNVTAGFITQSFAMADLDNDGDDDIVFGCNTNSNNAWGICAYDTGAGGLLTYFDSDGIKDDISRNSTSANMQFGGDFISPPMIVNLDGTGDKEIVFGVVIAANSLAGQCTEGNINAPTTMALRATGVQYWATSFVNARNAYGGCNGITQGEQYVSPPFIMKRNSTMYVCDSHNHNVFNRSDGCLLGTTGATIWTRNASNTSIPMYAAAGMSFLKNDTTGEDYFVMGETLYDINGSNLMHRIGTVDGLNANNSVSMADVLNDGNLEFIYTTSSPTALSTIAYMHSSVTAPVNSSSPLPSVINSPSTNNGFFGYYNGPICQGTTITFQAQECPGTGSGCNYNNEPSTESERLSTTCGTGVATVGAFALTNPRVNCTYPTAGTFSVTLFLQDQGNPGDLSQSSGNIPINVVNGIPGQTCNLQSNYIGSPTGTSGSTTSDDTETSIVFDNFWSLFFGDSQLLRFIAGFLFLAIAMILGYALPLIMTKHVQQGSTMLAVVFGFLTVIFNTFTSLWSPWILILIIVGSFGLALIWRILNTGQR